MYIMTRNTHYLPDVLATVSIGKQTSREQRIILASALAVYGQNVHTLLPSAFQPVFLAIVESYCETVVARIRLLSLFSDIPNA
jgi:hypothetical protein